MGWLRGPTFDLGLIVGVLALAIALGCVALVRPELLPWVLAADLWLLAYPHVASTFTRIAFDRRSVRAHRFLLFGLPPIVFVATASATWLGGAMALNTIYFHWQAWHYTRQSYGIARAYDRSARARASDRLTTAVIFAFPVWGLLHRAHQHPGTFYGAPLYTPPVPNVLVVASAIFALGALAAWTFRRLRTPTNDVGHDLFVVSHVAITVISYILVTDVTRGWLFINIWHNAQYLVFVWAQNAKRFRGGIDPGRRFLSRISQRENVGAYVVVCVGLGVVFYFALGQATSHLAWQVIPLFLVCHQTVNFHHYLVDAVIWRRRVRAPA